MESGESRVESPVLHFGFGISDFENGEPVESGEVRVEGSEWQAIRYAHGKLAARPSRINKFRQLGVQDAPIGEVV